MIYDVLFQPQLSKAEYFIIVDAQSIQYKAPVFVTWRDNYEGEV